MWLEASQSPTQSQEPTGLISITVRAWNLLGGLDWQGIPMVAELLGIEDVEWLVDQLTVIRGFNDAKIERERAAKAGAKALQAR